MAFDDSTGGADRQRNKHHSRGDATWGDDWGDRSFTSLWEASLAAQERAKADAPVDHAAKIREQIHYARIAVDATRRRSAPVEAEIERERAKKQRGSLGHMLAQAMAKAHQRDRKR